MNPIGSCITFCIAACSGVVNEDCSRGMKISSGRGNWDAGTAVFDDTAVFLRGSTGGGALADASIGSGDARGGDAYDVSIRWW